jgi:hypothetical protein
MDRSFVKLLLPLGLGLGGLHFWIGDGAARAPPHPVFCF